MAKDMDDCEFWLPSEILTDDDILMDYKPKTVTGSAEERGFYFPAVCQRGLSSSLSNSSFISPAESLRSSATETESDEEEDYLSGLTRKMADSTLNGSNIWKTQKKQATSGSPQSTLCGFTGCGSPNCRSPSALHHGGNGAWELLCAAADEVARMRMIERADAYSMSRGRRLMVPPRQRSSNGEPNLGILSDKSLSYQQFQVERFLQLQNQQTMKNQESLVQNRGGSRGRPLGLAPSAWPTLHQSQNPLRRQQPVPLQRPAMGAVFAGDAGTKRQCAGTGVFLPRPIAETSQRPAINTLNMNAMESPRQMRSHLISPFTRSNDAGGGFHCKVFQGQEMQHNSRSNAGMQMMMSQEFRLPSDWTY